MKESQASRTFHELEDHDNVELFKQMAILLTTIKNIEDSPTSYCELLGDELNSKLIELVQEVFIPRLLNASERATVHSLSGDLYCFIEDLYEEFKKN